jgi:hypothetical protein
MKSMCFSLLALLATLGCSAKSSDPVDGGYDAGYCPPGQAMPMPELCGLNNDPCNSGNSLHIGAWCTYQGGQCAQYGLVCAFDADQAEGENFCLSLCTLNSECGENACCSGDPKNPERGQRACVPNSCPDKVCDGG